METNIKTQTEIKKENLESEAKDKRITKFTVVLFWVLFGLVVGTIGFLVVMIVIGPEKRSGFGKDLEGCINDIVNCVFALILLLTPTILKRRFNLDIPKFMLIIYMTFLFLSIYLGSITDFYLKVPFFDTFVHTLSGFLIGTFSFTILQLLHKYDKIKLKPWFIFLFSICFAILIGVLWEIYEWTLDFFVNSNMQRYVSLETGEPFVGRAALYDTMKDLIVDLVGAVCAGIVGSVFYVKNNRSLKVIAITKKPKKSLFRRQNQETKDSTEK